MKIYPYLKTSLMTASPPLFQDQPDENLPLFQEQSDNHPLLLQDYFVRTFSFHGVALVDFMYLMFSRMSVSVGDCRLCCVLGVFRALLAPVVCWL